SPQGFPVLEALIITVNAERDKSPSALGWWAFSIIWSLFVYQYSGVVLRLQETSKRHTRDKFHREKAIKSD
ncbi:MAG: hypothetical protein J6N51_04990, partial [Selenomonas sp.]|nr:hypothetical protein [Selenomonas sp.]